MKEAAHLPKGVTLGVTKHDGVLRVEGDDEVVSVAPRRH
jgi:hypothetical protein